MTKFLNISTDNTLGGLNASDVVVSSQKAIRTAINQKVGADYDTSNKRAIFDGAIGSPGTPVHNSTISFTQGGATKGSFTLNQSGNATIALDAGGGGSVSIDNLTITNNASNQIQASAVVNNNDATAPVYNWVGTSAEYTAQSIETLHPEWLCYITDDDSIGNAYTKEESDGRYVHLTGNETILGAKTFAGTGISLRRKSTEIDQTVIPSETQYLSGVYLLDKNDLEIGNFEEMLRTNGNLEVNIHASRVVNGTKVYSPRILTGIKPDGTGYIEIPHVSYMIAPSSTYTTLTVGASGTIYTAPCDGWVFLSVTSTAAGAYGNIVCNRTRAQNISYSSHQGLFCSLFVGKGQTFIINYDNATNNRSALFIHSISSTI